MSAAVVVSGQARNCSCATTPNRPPCDHFYMNALGEGWIAGLESKREGEAGTALVRILVVDDLEPFRSLVSSILTKQAGYHIVGEAADGLEAVRRARETHPDLVVLDMGLPGLMGSEVARRIRLFSPGSAILFLTANNDPELARYVLDAGAMGYVLKIDVVTELAPAAKEILSGNRFVSRRLRDKEGFS